ncbi:MAG: penicillin-binding transpeptidase domain-containing protein, partial [Pyrinomonadaceae bacterium]
MATHTLLSPVHTGTAGLRLNAVGTTALCAVVVGTMLALAVISRDETSKSASDFDYALDEKLTKAATAALGEREGTVIVMDPRTGRVRVVVNPQVAFATTLAPGSTIKPFTTLAGLRTGLIEKERRIVCREHFTTGDFATVCSHPTGLPSFGAAEAIAYSCNYYFGRLGEQLRESSFDSTLAEFGFGRPTGINWTDGREAAGKLPHGSWRAQNALGESDQLQVTPIQLLNAYSALVNGQQLLVPRIAPGKDFVAQPRAEIVLSKEQRQLIVDGMRGAVRYGTVERAHLHSLPLYIFGKTGTSTEIGGFRTQGWFVGFASQPASSTLHNPSSSENLGIAVLVFLERARGVDAAELARPIFEQFSRGVQNGDGETSRPANTIELKPAVSPNLRDTVSLPTGTLLLEDYVLGVVAAEGSTETEPEALKALAVAARTYALKNLARHADQNYDFCTLTHCQRYRAFDAASLETQVSSAIVAAVKQTSGEALREANGATVDSYFSASCGGATANISTLWNTKSLPYLIGGEVQFCLTEPHHAWTDVISSADLLRALNSDPRTEVGGKLTSIVTKTRDASGRAQTIAIRGERSRTVSGWDFKSIVGRALGWNLLKSSR